MNKNENIEQTRQKLWCDIVTSLIDKLSFEERIVSADLHVREFDERFGTKHNEAIDKFVKDYNENLTRMLSIRFSEIEPIVILDESELKIVFGNNQYRDVSRLADVSLGYKYFGGIVDGKEILVVLKND